MTDDPIAAFLARVAALLRGDAGHRQAILDEMEAHLCDAAAAYEEEGLSPAEAVERVLTEFGPPEAVAAGFADTAAPVKAIRGVRRWLPLVLPTLTFVATVVLLVTSLRWLPHPTVGERIVLRLYIEQSIFVAAWWAATYFAIARADRDRLWRWVAWSFSAFFVLRIVFTFASVR
jgi:hypothetical protein